MEDAARQFGDYTLHSLIGRGRSTLVYQATRPDSDETFAVKVFDPQRTADPEFAPYFDRLMAYFQEVRHPYILPILDHGYLDEYAYLVMPYLPRKGLDAWLAQSGAAKRDTVLAVLDQVAGAVDALNEHGLPHGGIHPSNLLVAEDGAMQVVDSGLAVLLSRTISSDDGASSLAVIGKPAIMAPELATSGTPSHAADVYALGAVLYEMLAGRPPYHANSTLELIWLHTRAPIPRITDLRPELPAGIDDLIASALAKNPADRPRSARDLAAQYRIALETAPIDYQPPPVPEGLDPISAEVAARLSPRTRFIKGLPRHLVVPAPKPRLALPAAGAEEIPWLALAGIGAAVIVLFALILLGSRSIFAARAPIPTATPGVFVLPPTRVAPGPPTGTAFIVPTLFPSPTPPGSDTPWPSYTPPVTDLPTATVTRSAGSGSSSGGGGGLFATPIPALTYTPGAIFTLGVILPQTPGAPPSPSSNAILFSRDGQIFAINTDGSGLVQLTSGPGRQFYPTRAGQIAFYSDRDGNFEIYVMGTNGTNQTRLTNDPASDTDPAWSRDGSQIAFATTRSGGTDIYRMAGNGSGLAPVVNDPAQDRYPSWGPSGQIVFASNRDGGDFDLFIVNQDGSGLSQLTTDSVDQIAPSWSPDGSRIAYVSGGNVWVMDVASRGTTQLTSIGGAQGVSWSGDSGQIAFSSGGDLWVIGAGVVPRCASPVVRLRMLIRRGQDKPSAISGQQSGCRTYIRFIWLTRYVCVIRGQFGRCRVSKNSRKRDPASMREWRQAAVPDDIRRCCRSSPDHLSDYRLAPLEREMRW